MKNWIKKNWKDTVWSKVFAAIIIGVFSIAGSFILFILKRLFYDYSESFYQYIISNISIPIWLLIFMIISIIVLTYISFKKFNSKENDRYKKIHKGLDVLDRLKKS